MEAFCSMCGVTLRSGNARDSSLLRSHESGALARRAIRVAISQRQRNRT
jgi:hypothetical protein